MTVFQNTGSDNTYETDIEDSPVDYNFRFMESEENNMTNFDEEEKFEDLTDEFQYGD